MNSPFQSMKTLLTTAVLSVALWGCTAPTVVEAEEVPQRHRALTDQYAVFDNASELAKHLYLEQVTRDPDAVPKVVQFNLRNSSDAPYDFRYRCRWLDEHGIQIDSSTDVWQTRTIHGRERMNLVCVAPSPAAVDYRLVLRPWERRK